MNESHMFKTSDGKFEISVKSEFLSKVDKPETVDIYELMTKHKMNQFLHNTKGPAILRLKDGNSEYWINGHKLSDEEGKKVAHKNDFNNRLMTMVEE